MDFLSRLFSTEFMPHGHCYLWLPGLVGLHLVSDSLIALSYATIPISLVYFVRRRTDLPFNWMFLCFGVFIVACGATHAMEVVTLWTPIYWVSGAVKVVTAAASLVTAVLLIKLIPQALALPSPEDLRRANSALEERGLALERQTHELEAALRVKDRFLATVSHELRTPLNAVIGFTGVLLMRLSGPLNPVQEHQLGTVQSSAKHLLSLINDILDLAKVTSGHVEIGREPVVCQDLLAEVIAALRPAAEQKGLALEVSTPPQPVVVTTSRRAVSQILLNLGGNAIRFTERGEVRFELAQAVSAGSTRTEFRVIDTGIGIREEDRAQLFQPFTQLEPSHPGAQEGSGLGLHLSRRLAELLGGDIEVRSELGKGSTFTLVLTASQVEGAEARGAPLAGLG